MKSNPLKVVLVFDTFQKGIPKKVMDDVYNLWVNNELGSDYYYINFSIEEDKDNYPNLAKFLSEAGIEKECLVYHWR